MAGAIIPLAVAAAPLLEPLVKALVMRVEHLFGAKTGPTKLDAVLAALTPVVGQLATAGKLPGQLSPSDLLALVENVVRALKGAGVLNPDTAAVVAAQPIAVSSVPTGPIRITGGTLQLSFGS